jgi:chorismate mutase
MRNEGDDVAVRAIRGATRVLVDGQVADDREMMLAATRELVSRVLDSNGLCAEDLISVLFTATRDLTAVAPALAARQLGLDEVALICTQEMWVPGSMTGVIRLLVHVETAASPAEIQNVYLNGTDSLRGDPPPVPDGRS